MCRRQRVNILTVNIQLFSAFNAGKKGETNNTEVVYEDPEDYISGADNGGRRIMVQECLAYERPREVGVELEECQAYGKLPNTR